jgi:hypothetical protein
MGKSTISMAMFNSYDKLPEGMPSNQGSRQLLSSTIPIFHLQEKQLASAQKSWSTEQEKLKFAKELNASLLQNRPLTEFFHRGLRGRRDGLEG